MISTQSQTSFYFQAHKKKSTVFGGRDKDNKENQNIIEKKEIKLERPSLIPVINQEPPRVTRARTKSLKGNEDVKPLVKAIPEPAPKVSKEVSIKPTLRRSKSVSRRQSEAKNHSTSTSGEESLYQTAIGSPILDASPAGSL